MKNKRRKFGKVINNFFQKSHKISFFQSRDKEGGLIFRVLQVKISALGKVLGKLLQRECQVL